MLNLLGFRDLEIWVI